MKKIHTLTQQQKLIFKNYFEEVERIKNLKSDTEKLKKPAEHHKIEASKMIQKQMSIASALRNIEFNKLKAEFQNILISMKLKIVNTADMSNYPTVLSYTFAEGADIAYIDLKNILTELEIPVQ